MTSITEAKPAPAYEETAVRRVTIITTGGTIEKVYDESTGGLANKRSIIRSMLNRLRLEGTETNIVELMSKDSLEFDDRDRERIIECVRTYGAEDADCKGVVILHGTDTLHLTGEALHKALPRPTLPVVLTGAMRPYEMKRSDALQNLTEAMFATSALEPGVYCAFHGRSLRFPGVVKDRERYTFMKP